MSKKKIFSIFYILLILSLTILLISCGGGAEFTASNTPKYYFAVTTIDINNVESDMSPLLDINQDTALQQTLTWTQPETYSNGDTLLPSDIKTYRLYAGTVPGRFIRTYDVGTATQISISSLNPALPI